MSEQAKTIAIEQAQRAANHLGRLYPRHHGRAVVYTNLDGTPIQPPYCGGERSGWMPPPGVPYIRAEYDLRAGQGCAYILHQPE